MSVEHKKHSILAGTLNGMWETFSIKVVRAIVYATVFVRNKIHGNNF